MTSPEDWFHSSKPIPKGYVYMGDDHAVELVGAGTIKLRMYDDTICTIQDVRHVKGLKNNLLSIGQFHEIGLKIEIENGIMKAIKGAFLVIKAEKLSSKLFVLQGDTLKHGEASIASTCYEESTIMWH